MAFRFFGFRGLCGLILLVVFTLGFSLGCGTVVTQSDNNSGIDDDSLPLNQVKIGIDYDPSVRCSDQGTVAGAVACMPQASFADCGDPTSEDNLSGCPDRCLNCFDTDLQNIQSQLGVTELTVYQPNYYIAKAAQQNSLKIILGTCDDFITALAAPSGQETCTICGSPSLCGSDAAESLINGSCRGTTPWDPTQFCEAKCKSGFPCTNGDCSCTGDSQCGGTSGSCDLRGYYPAFKDYLSDGTVLGIQLGNEVLSASVDGQPLTKAQVLAAAKVLRDTLNSSTNNLSNIPIIVSLQVGNEQHFCENGLPPANVDKIAAHPYCNDVASVPPMWPLESGNSNDTAAEDCASQVWQLFQDNAQKYCGADKVFIGETGYNTGCPGVGAETTHLAVAPLFVDKILGKACTMEVPLFLFEYADVCPAGGCLPGCPSQPNLGNGYFGIYHTDAYGTKGGVSLKYASTPSLQCP